MSKVIKRYFIADNERAQQIAKDGLALVNEASRNRSAYLAEVGVDGLWERRHQAPFGIVVYQEEGAQRPGYLKPEQQTEDGKRFWIHRPDKRTTIGKAALKALAKLSTFDFSDYACKAFGVSYSVIGWHRESRSGMAMYSSAAGFMKGVMVFCIPFGDDGNHHSPPVIPEDLREIKKSEYIALTEEGES